MKLVIISLFTVIVAIAFTSYLGKAEESQERSPEEKMERLEELLKKTDIDYRKEIKDHVTKPCVAFYADYTEIQFEDLLSPITPNRQEIIDGIVSYMASHVQKMERGIYDAVENEDQEMRMLYYAISRKM